MGIDYFDLTIRLEKRFGVRITDDVWVLPPPAVEPTQYLTAAAVAAAVTHLLGRGPRPVLGETTATPPQTAALGWLEYESAHGAMPVSLPLFDPAVWPGVVADVAAAIGVKPAKVFPASRLIQDLGMC